MMQITEKQFNQQVCDLARLMGWRVFKTWPPRSASNYATLVAGFPDLVMVRPPDLIFAELKAEKGRLTAIQQEWLGDLMQIPLAQVFVWRPSDWEAIVIILEVKDEPVGTE